MATVTSSRCSLTQLFNKWRRDFYGKFTERKETLMNGKKITILIYLFLVNQVPPLCYASKDNIFCLYIYLLPFSFWNCPIILIFRCCFFELLPNSCFPPSFAFCFASDHRAAKKKEWLSPRVTSINWPSVINIVEQSIPQEQKTN